MTAAHGLRDPAGRSALGAEGSASCATAVGGALPAASGHPRAAAGPAAIAGIGRPPAAAAPHCASQPRPPAPRGEAGGPAFRSPRRFAPSPPCPLRAGAHVALPTVRSCPAPAATPGPRWRRGRVKRVRKGSGRERGTVGALRSRAPRCPRNPGRRLPYIGFPREKPAAAGRRCGAAAQQPQTGVRLGALGTLRPGVTHAWGGGDGTRPAAAVEEIGTEVRAAGRARCSDQIDAYLCLYARCKQPRSRRPQLALPRGSGCGRSSALRPPPAPRAPPFCGCAPLPLVGPRRVKPRAVN